MGSAIGTCEEVIDELLSRGEKVGVLKSPPLSPVLRRPPAGGAAGKRRAVAVLDRTKEPGALAEPLYLDV